MRPESKKRPVWIALDVVSTDRGFLATAEVFDDGVGVVARAVRTDANVFAACADVALEARYWLAKAGFSLQSMVLSEEVVRRTELPFGSFSDQVCAWNRANRRLAI